MFLPTSHHLVELLELLHPHEGRPCPPFGGVNSGNPGGGHGGESDEEQLEDYKPLREESRTGDGSDGDEKKKHRTYTETEDGKNGVGVVDLSAVVGLGKEDLRSGAVHAAVARAAAGLIVRETVCYRWNAGLPELCAGTQARLEKLLEGSRLPADGGARRCRARVKSVHAAVGRASVETAARRGQGNKHPGEAGPINTFRGVVRAPLLCFPHFFFLLYCACMPRGERCALARSPFTGEASEVIVVKQTRCCCFVS